MWSLTHKREENKSCFYFLQKYFVEYTRVAEIHGIKYLSKRTAFERLLWGILTMCFIVVCLGQILILSSRYVSSSYVTTFASENFYVYDVPFPAITICPQDSLDAEKIKENRKNPNDTYLREEFDLMEEFFCSNKKSNVSMDNIGDMYEIMDQFSFNFRKLLKSCKWRNKLVDCSKIFTKILIKDQICFSFNFIDKTQMFRETTFLAKHFFESYNKTNNWDQDYGYKKSLNLDNYPRRVFEAYDDESLELIFEVLQNNSYCKPKYPGYQVSVHNPIEFPFPHRHFFEISANSVFLVSLEPESYFITSGVKNFFFLDRKCFLGSEKKLEHFKQYSNKKCIMECIANLTKTKCGCVPYYLFRAQDVPVCASKQFMCVEEIEIARNLDKSILSSCNCLLSCTYLNYKPTVSTFPSKKNDNLVRLLFTFKDYTFIKIKKYEIFNIITFIGRVGCLFGLYTGASIITVVEFLYFWSARIIFNKRLYGRYTGPTFQDFDIKES